MVYFLADISPDRYKNDIREAKRNIFSQWDLNPQSMEKSHIDPIPFAHYVGLFSDRETSILMGFSELYYYRDLENGYRSSLYAKYFNLEEICDTEKTAHVRTIYLKEPFRKKMGYFLSLYLHTAYKTINCGIEYVTLATYKHDDFLQKMYRKMGGNLLCTTDIPGVMDNVNFYLIDLSELVSQPLARRYNDQFLRNEAKTLI